MTGPIELTVNGAPIALADVEPRVRLADLLRERLALTSVHLGCEQGICGACTVLIDGQPAKSCIVMAFQVRGARVETVEGLAPEDGDLHPVQRSFHEHHGLQCGFCTPGMVLSACALLRRDPAPGEHAIREAISGNLCRCTGYESIVDAIRAVSTEPVTAP